MDLALNENSNLNNIKNEKEYKISIKKLIDFFHSKNRTSILLSDAKIELSLKGINWDSEFLEILKNEKAIKYEDISKTITYLNKKKISNKNEFLEELKEHENGLIYENFYHSFNNDLELLKKEGVVKVISFEGIDKKILFYRNMEDEIEKLLFNEKGAVDELRKIWKNSKLTDSIN